MCQSKVYLALDAWWFDLWETHNTVIYYILSCQSLHIYLPCFLYLTTQCQTINTEHQAAEISFSLSFPCLSKNSGVMEGALISVLWGSWSKSRKYSVLPHHNFSSDAWPAKQSHQGFSISMSLSLAFTEIPHNGPYSKQIDCGALICAWPHMKLPRLTRG